MSTETPPTTSPASGAAAPTANRNRRGNRGNKQGHGGGGTAIAPSQTTSGRAFFKGTVPEMNGHVFECIGERATRPQFAKTMEALRDYVKIKMSPHSEDLNSLFNTPMSAPTLVAPERPDPDFADALAIFDYQEDKKIYNKRVSALRGNLAALFAVIWGQCSEALRSKLKALDRYNEALADNDCHWLLQQVRSIVLNFDRTKKLVLSLQEAKVNFLTCTQKQHETIEAHMENVRAWAEAIEAYGGTVVDMPKPSTDERSYDAWYAEAREESMALVLIRGADPSRFGSLRNELQSFFGQGVDRYPSTLTSAYNFLLTYSGPNNANRQSNAVKNTSNAVSPTASNPNLSTPQRTTAPEVSAMTFAQMGSTVIPGDNGEVFDNILCFKCRNHGHFANHCPTKTATVLLQHGYNLTQTAYGTSTLDANWILLDSQSNISVFRNAGMLSNIRKSGEVLHAVTNGGSQTSEYIGDFQDLGTVWYNPDSIANILSLADVRRVCRVTMDTGVEPSFTVHRQDGTSMKFVEYANKLYVYAPRNDSDSVNVYSITCLQTVAERKTMFTKRERDAADAARALYRKLGRPSEEDFQRILRSNLILNCPVTPTDAQRALTIYGPDVAFLKGTSKRSPAAPHVPSFMPTPLPPPIIEHHRNITLCADFFYVQQLPFFHTISRNIGFRTISSVKDRTKRTILRETNEVIKLYHTRGFVVRDLHADNDFACIRGDLRPINLDIVPADSHVGEVERSIQTIKSRLRSAVHGLPYKRLPKIMIVELVHHVIRLLNQFPWKNGVSNTMSPTTIVTGRGLPDYNQLSLEFGSYVQIFEDLTPSNTLHSRTLGAIALNPTGNNNGDYSFLSLATGRVVTRRSWTELPILDTAIARVEALAALDNMPLIQADGLVIEWRPDVSITDDEYDIDYIPPNLYHADDNLDHDFLPITHDEIADLSDDLPLPVDPDQGADTAIGDNINDTTILTDASHPNFGENEGTFGTNTGIEPNGIINNENDEGANEPDVEEENDEGADEDDEGANEPDVEEDDEVANNDNEDSPPEQEATTRSAYNLRPRHERNQGPSFMQAVDDPHSNQSYFPPVQLMQQSALNDDCSDSLDPTRRIIFAHVLTQMSERVGLEKHGQMAEEALLKEFKQLENLSVFEPLMAENLHVEERKGALRALNLLKEKRDGSIKGRTVADGSKQRQLYEKSQTTSPTVSNDALITTIVIDALEERDVATCDVAGAYLNADMDEKVILKFVGKSVELICKMDSKYTPFVTTEGNKQVLYVNLKKALYGCVRSALLWYRLFAGTLQQMGFVLNPYDQCVANGDFNGQQCTIAWYVDDMKISHVDPEIVTAVIKNIEASFGNMSVTRGKSHEFLGMQIQYNDNKTATIGMKSYLEEAITESGLEVKKTVATPAKRFLFEVDESSPLLSKERHERFHRVSAKLLYVAMRGRADILLAVCFLCTRVSKATEEDEIKLLRVLQYIKGTIDMTYTVGASNLDMLQAWVDASYAVHNDMKSHTGGIMSFGIGGIVCRSTKQKLNTKSSTEAEVVGVSDYMPNMLWLKHFLQGQGYTPNEIILEQDNESAIKLEKNGWASAGKKSRHIDIRFFFIKDRVASNDIKVRHCPTERMVADFFTKPLQGELFRKLRGVIMGHQPMEHLIKGESVMPEERVGKIRAMTDSVLKKCDVAKKQKDISKKVTWAEVVKRGEKGFERSFSRNNPGVTVRA